MNKVEEKGEEEEEEQKKEELPSLFKERKKKSFLPFRKTNALFFSSKEKIGKRSKSFRFLSRQKLSFPLCKEPGFLFLTMVKDS